MISRRHLALLAVLALSTLGAASAESTSVSTEEAMALLTRPATAGVARRDVDYHGIVPSFLVKHTRLHDGINRQEQVEDDSVEVQRERNSHSRVRINVDQYPPKDQIPDVNHPQVKAWVSEIDWSKVPNIPVAQGLPDAPRFPKCPPKDQVNPNHCWWSCDGCLQSDDVVSCPTEGHWGLTYDDGPSMASKALVKYLGEKDLSATFFIVGSRVVEYPDILREQVAAGHHIAMHTWSHGGLTTLTNEQIVAEVKWTEKIIRDVTGLTMKYIRPPYGDCDNRVREILRQMGYTNVIWSQGWDTNDWRLPLHMIKTPEIISTFQNALENVRLIKSRQTGSLEGPITLEHDLTLQTVDLSKTIISIGMEKGLKPMNLAQCLSDLSPYQGNGKSSVPLNKDNAAAQAPKSNNNNAKTMSGGKSKEVTAPADGAPSQDSSDSASAAGGSSSTTTKGKKSAAASLQSLGVVALGGISAIVSYFLIL
ncbi:chitin deacetylase [Linnemannia schmuckeri]|uniref:Chitin deacetylase n=1 Tax=Linnemannia schmuckeri TaxID=64567 RepID=A0A9P5S1A3_9FUNG|nr:chitin deacetylase [Linnemannia schmuckeri]